MTLLTILSIVSWAILAWSIHTSRPMTDDELDAAQW